jgi:stalled ribosome alternative rescue factor ArfA
MQIPGKTTTMARNEHAASLTLRAGNAGCAVAVDTRHKVVKARKGAGSYQRRSKFGGRHDD